MASNLADVNHPLKASAVAERSSRRSSSVLVVEDDPDQQWRLARMLTVNGNRVVGTSSGDGALALIAEWPVDLVLINDGLPGMSGLALAEKIRKDYPRVAIALMTASDPRSLGRKALALGAFACFAKPLAQEAIEGLLRLVPA